jgi:hypothetical protein
MRNMILLILFALLDLFTQASYALGALCRAHNVRKSSKA